MCEPRLRRSLGLGLSVCLLVSVAFGAEPVPSERKSIAGTKTTITSERMTVRNKDRRAIFEGSVVLTKGSLVVHSDVMVVFYKARDEDNSAGRPRSGRSGAPSQDGDLSVRKIEATGQVKIEIEDGRATCRKAVYYQDEQKIVLTGRPVAWQQGNRVTGRQITIFLDEDRTIVEGGTRLMLDEGGSEP